MPPNKRRYKQVDSKNDKNNNNQRMTSRSTQHNSIGMPSLKDLLSCQPCDGDCDEEDPTKSMRKQNMEITRREKSQYQSQNKRSRRDEPELKLDNKTSSKLSEDAASQTLKRLCIDEQSESQKVQLKNDSIVQEEKGVKVVKNSKWFKDPIENYKMSAKERGICLIINNVDFDLDSLARRSGSDMDAKRFSEVFRELGFKTVDKRNLTSDQMKYELKNVAASRCIAEHDALIVILLSHGNESAVYGVDGLEVDLNLMMFYFDNKNCRQMRNKPKVFIIQACRGRMVDYGLRETQTFFSQPQTQAITQQYSQFRPSRFSVQSDFDSDYIPTRADMVLCFSCPVGHSSTRNDDEGSWLGVFLANHLQREACKRHLIDIFNMVSRDMKRKRSTNGHKQVIEITTIGFDRNLYFHPGLYEDN